MVHFPSIENQTTPLQYCSVCVDWCACHWNDVILWKFSSPISDNLVSGRYSVQLVPQVNGPVSIIHAEPNTPLKKGVDKLFEVERDSYQFKYDQAVSGLNAAEKGIEQAAAGVASAQAAITKSKASLAATDAELTVAKETAKLSPGAISKIKVKHCWNKSTQPKLASNRQKQPTGSLSLHSSLRKTMHSV